MGEQQSVLDEMRRAVEYVTAKYGRGGITRIVSPAENDPAVCVMDLEPIPGTGLCYMKSIRLLPGCAVFARPAGGEGVEAGEDEQVAVPVVLGGGGEQFGPPLG